MSQVPFAHAVVMEDEEDSGEAIAAANAATRQQVVVAPPSRGVERLPSNLTYKDQGRDLQSVLQQGRVLERLPSNLSYKDQGRELHSVLQPAEPQAVEAMPPPPPQQQRLPELPSDLTYKQQGNDLVSVLKQQQPTSGTAQFSTSPSLPAFNIIGQNPSAEPTQHPSSWWHKLVDHKKWILPVVVFVVMIVLAVAVSSALSKGGE